MNTPSKEQQTLPLPSIRCMTKQQAADYLGIGVTLFNKLGLPPIRLGRRCVYDKVDLDRWLDDYKGRGRAIEEEIWLENVDSIGGKIRHSGGSMSSCTTDDEYVKALDLKTKTPPTSS